MFNPSVTIVLQLLGSFEIKFYQFTSLTDKTEAYYTKKITEFWLYTMLDIFLNKTFI